ncbi:hypothetical protein [Nonomuraea turcica]|uniref:hypothetical protein n=1 Tax=Nonomuraea sp. G32 TaxID=3067274 RepID=UPI00273BF482|nr:hypothetical protein [Nonomuraea sp. G32]MDP4500783.1 hypothetical protein [Nonomuraea sp. G32]
MGMPTAVSASQPNTSKASSVRCRPTCSPTAVSVALNEIVTSIQHDIATLTATAAQTQDHLATPILPQQAIVGPRRLPVHRLTVDQLQITVNP